MSLTCPVLDVLPVVQRQPLVDFAETFVSSVVQHDDQQAVRAIENRFNGVGFPRKMTWDVGQTGVYQPPEEIMSGPGRVVNSQFDIWSCLRLRGLGGRLERYEGGLSAVSRDRIESTHQLRDFPTSLIPIVFKVSMLISSGH